LKIDVGFEVFMAVEIQVMVDWVVMPCPTTSLHSISTMQQEVYVTLNLSFIAS
jgi:hypothetical protein